MKKMMWSLLAIVSISAFVVGCQKQVISESQDATGGRKVSKLASQTAVYTPATAVATQGQSFSFDVDFGTCGTAQLQQEVPVGSGTWVSVVNSINAVSGNDYTHTFTPTVVGDCTYKFRVVASGGQNCTTATGPIGEYCVKVVAPPSCVTAFTGAAVSCGTSREANFTFSNQGDIDYVKIQGGLTNFTGADAVITVTGGTGTYSVAQSTPGGSSNRVITVIGKASCNPININIKWGSTNSGGEITGQWSAKDAGGVDLAAPVAPLICN